MDIFIDSTQSTFAALIFKDNNIVAKEFETTKYKVEKIISFFDGIENVSNIQNIYVNIGPGSFTGSRISLIYIRTLAQINPNLKIFITNTFDLLKQLQPWYKKSQTTYIPATKNKSYCKQNGEIVLVNKSKKEQHINYEKLAKNFAKHQSIFKQCSSEDLQPIYASNPQIGKEKQC